MTRLPRFADPVPFNVQAISLLRLEHWDELKIALQHAVEEVDRCDIEELSFSDSVSHL